MVPFHLPGFYITHVINISVNVYFELALFLIFQSIKMVYKNFHKIFGMEKAHLFIALVTI